MFNVSARFVDAVGVSTLAVLCLGMLFWIFNGPWLFLSLVCCAVGMLGVCVLSLTNVK